MIFKIANDQVFRGYGTAYFLIYCNHLKGLCVELFGYDYESKNNGLNGN